MSRPQPPGCAHRCQPDTAKWGIEGFYESLTAEVEPFGITTTVVEPGMIRSTFYQAATRVPVSPPYRGTPADRAPIPLEQMPGDQAKVAAVMIDAALAPDPPRRLVLGADAYRLVHDGLAARLAGVEAQKGQAAAADVDGWS